MPRKCAGSHKLDLPLILRWAQRSVKFWGEFKEARLDRQVRAKWADVQMDEQRPASSQVVEMVVGKAVITDLQGENPSDGEHLVSTKTPHLEF